jgi:peroxiredoxin
MKSKLLVIFSIIVAAALGGWALLDQKNAAPAVSATTLEGKTLNLADLRGKVVLVNFWATSCTTCMAEMPKLVSMQQKYATQGYQTLAVAMDYDPADYVKTYVEKTRLPFIVAHDSKGDIAKAFGGIRLTPTSMLIDKQGRIVQTYLGEPDFEKFQALVEKLLKEA